VSGRLHLALLRGAALLVRAPDREEWLAEWRAELWYVGRKRRTAFCLGAFRDAFWLRCHSPSPPMYLRSPWQCLAVLAALAALSVVLALQLPSAREALFPPAYPDASRLATISGISVDNYRKLPGSASDLAFYRTVWARTSPAKSSRSEIALALASRNLFDVLRIPVLSAVDQPAAALILSHAAWREYFGGDPKIVGRRLTLDGRQAQVTAVITDRAWLLPGRADAWLLVDDRSFDTQTRGNVLARMSPPNRLISVFNAEGGVDRFTCVPVAEPQPFLAFLLVMAATGMVLPAVTSMSLGEYPANRHALSRGAGMRRWIFLGVKIVLVLPIVLFGSVALFSMIAVGLQAHGMIVSSVIGFRWVLMDQRRRCPICLRLLSNPTTIGQASRTLLELYGTELMCAKGHGLLHVPEIRNSYSEQRWLHLDSSWSSLF